MFGNARDAGLLPRFPSPAEGLGPTITDITEEAGVTAPRGQPMRLGPTVEEGTVVAQGEPLATLRGEADFTLVAPMAARVARVRLLPGRQLSEIVLFAEPTGDRHQFDLPKAALAGEDAALRLVLLRAGIWPWLRRRPFGGMPARAERPAAIFVMAADSRPFAPDPFEALAGREEAFQKGLWALSRLTEGTVFLCHPARTPLEVDKGLEGRVRRVKVGPRHPQGLAGIQIHRVCPAGPEHPVWDLHVEDVAAIGELLTSGLLPETRLVRIAGDAARSRKSVWTQPGADLRGLTQNLTRAGAHRLMSGSPLDGQSSRWLDPRDRQVSVLGRPPSKASRHWFAEALGRKALPPPLIPTSALSHALGQALPVAAFLRALACGDGETAQSLGLLSLLEEDLALVDYVLGDRSHFGADLRAMLDQVKEEIGA